MSSKPFVLPPAPSEGAQQPSNAIVMPAAPISARDAAGRFLPGVTGNPNGRPVVAAEVKKLARSYGAEAIEQLAALMRDPACPHATRKAAADSLLDRGYGKPIAHIEAGPAGAFDELDDDELDSYIKRKAREMIIDNEGGEDED